MKAAQRVRRARKPDSRPPASRQARDVTLIVANMRCGGCMASVEKALLAAPGVASARANLAAKRVAVRFDPQRTDSETLANVLEHAGFHAAEATHISRRDSGAPERGPAAAARGGRLCCGQRHAAVGLGVGGSRERHGRPRAVAVPLAVRTHRVAGDPLCRRSRSSAPRAQLSAPDGSTWTCRSRSASCSRPL